jgi:hypothetical protein
MTSFSENYNKGIKSSNVKTIFSGDILARNGEGLNAFCRTEFEAVINNSNIKTINGIDKVINATSKGKEYQ